MKKEELLKLKEEIESVEVSYYYDDVYNELYNLVIDYQNKTDDYDFEHLFEDYITYDTAEEIAKHELEEYGLLRLKYFLNTCNFKNDILKLNGYGNLEDVNKEDLEALKSDIINNIDIKMAKKED